MLAIPFNQIFLNKIRELFSMFGNVFPGNKQTTKLGNVHILHNQKHSETTKSNRNGKNGGSKRERKIKESPGGHHCHCHCHCGEIQMEAWGMMSGKPCELYVRMKMKLKKLNGVCWNWIPFLSSSHNNKKIHRSKKWAQTHKIHNRFAATTFTDLINDPKPPKPTMGSVGKHS